jgi:predicted AlkP superfamily phosphohydrolase/phosphomutase
LEEENWDFFMTIFLGMNRVQHFFWKYVDETHDKYVQNEYTEKMKEYYVKIDGILGRFLKSVDDDVLVMVVSDTVFAL